jgi:hypothetical protein
VGPAVATTPPASEPSPGSPGGEPAAPSAGADWSPPQTDLGATLDQALRDTTASLDRLLSNLGLPLLNRR